MWLLSIYRLTVSNRKVTLSEAPDDYSVMLSSFKPLRTDKEHLCPTQKWQLKFVSRWYKNLPLGTTRRGH
jgi:hypothetical protein